MTKTRFLAAALAATLGSTLAAPAFAQTAAAAAKPASAKPAAKATQPSFANPDEAVKALVAAIRAGDRKAVVALMGPGSDYWLFSGDDVSDSDEWARFLAAYDRKNAIAKSGDARATLVIGDDDWTLPSPLVLK